MFDASGWQEGELWGTSGFKKLKILQIVTACAKGAFCDGEQESGDHESAVVI